MLLRTSFTTVLRMSATAAIVILCVLAVRLLLRRAPAVWRYALWAVVLFRLLCPVSIPAAFSILPSDLRSSANLAEWRAETPPVGTDFTVSTTEALLPDSPAASVGVPAAAASPAGEASPAFADLYMVCGAVWLIGALGLLVCSAVSLVRLRRRLAGAVLLRDNIWCADRIDTPFVLGLCRPRIYLPIGLTAQEEEYIVLHERFHLRHGDHILRLLAFFALCLHWFNPLVWLAFALAGRDMEMRCDEAVLGALGGDIRAEYSQSLLALATGRRLPAATPLAFGAGDTKRRIRNVLGWRKPPLRITICALALCLLATAACAVDPADGAAADDPFGHAYAVEAAPYENGMFGGGYYNGSTETCYRISPAGDLLHLYDADDRWIPVGTFAETALSESNFDAYINGEIGAEMRQNNEKSWRLDSDWRDGGFYYLLQQTDGTILLSYGYDSEEMRLIRWVRRLRATADCPTDLYGAYVPNGCLYMNPLSSFLAVGGDDGKRYFVDGSGFAIDDRRGGVTVIDPVDWGWQDFPWTADEWDALFWGGRRDAPALVDHEELRYQPISEEFCLARADGELWLIELRENDAMGRYIWSIFRLVPEEMTGLAYWTFEPLRDAASPVFRFSFELPHDRIEVFCTAGQLQNGAENGTLLACEAGEVLCWSPLAEEGLPAARAEIRFTIQNGQEPITGGTLYIEQIHTAVKGKRLYTARVVGAGRTMLQADDGTAVIR